MITFCCLVIVAALIYYYMHRDKHPQQQPQESEASAPTAPDKPKENTAIVWKDYKRKLYMKGGEAFLEYGGDTYTFSCQPYEPMALICSKGKVVANIHNSFRVEEECEILLKGQLVHTITGKYHNAERFARLITTAIDTSCDRIDEVEDLMFEDLVFDKGADAMEYATYDFRCDKILYDGIALLLGHFICYKDGPSETMPGKDELQDLFVYALAFGYQHNGTDMYEYYLISEAEYKMYKQWPDHKEWSSHEVAYEWHEAHLANRQVLCNEFSHMKKTYKPFFRISELPKDYWHIDPLPFFSIKYARGSVCAQDDYVNHAITIELPEDATVKDLVDYICRYQDDNGYAAIPYTGGNALWAVESKGETLAELYDDCERIRYFGADTPLRSLQLSSVHGHRIS